MKKRGSLLLLCAAALAGSASAEEIGFMLPADDGPNKGGPVSEYALPNILDSNILSAPDGSDREHAPSYVYPLCARTREQIELYKQKLLAQENFDPELHDLDTPDSGLTDEYRAQFKDPAKRAAFIAKRRAEGYGTTVFEGLQERPHYYELTLKNTANDEVTKTQLYKCDFYEAPADAPENSQQVGAEYQGVVATTPLDPAHARDQALDFVKSREVDAESGLYGVTLDQTAGAITITFRKAIVSAQDWNIPSVIYYLKKKYVFNLADHTVYEEQKLYHTGEGQLDEKILQKD